jgi:hypothetical protein
MPPRPADVPGGQPGRGVVFLPPPRTWPWKASLWTLQSAAVMSSLARHPATWPGTGLTRSLARKYDRALAAQNWMIGAPSRLPAPPHHPRKFGDLFNASKYALDIKMTVRYEWRGTSQDARPAISGLARLCRRRKGCVPHAVSDLTPARPPGSATPGACRSEAAQRTGGAVGLSGLKLHTLMR